MTIIEKERKLINEFDVPDVILKREILKGADLELANFWYIDAFTRKQFDKGLPVMRWLKRRRLIKLLKKICPMHAPRTGGFVAYKAVISHGYEEKPFSPVVCLIAKLYIPKGAKVSSAFGRKCRSNKAVVLSIYNPKSGIEYEKATSPISYKQIYYHVGETVRSAFNRNRFKECAPGIRFFMTEQEAIDFGELVHNWF